MIDASISISVSVSISSTLIMKYPSSESFRAECPSPPGFMLTWTLFLLVSCCFPSFPALPQHLSGGRDESEKQFMSQKRIFKSYFLLAPCSNKPWYHLKSAVRTWLSASPLTCEADAELCVISPYLAGPNEMTVAVLRAPWIFYFLISSCAIAALAVPPLGDIIIVITTSSSSCRQIIFFFPSPFFCSSTEEGKLHFSPSLSVVCIVTAVILHHVSPLSAMSIPQSE